MHTECRSSYLQQTSMNRMLQRRERGRRRATVSIVVKSQRRKRHVLGFSLTETHSRQLKMRALLSYLQVGSKRKQSKRNWKQRELHGMALIYVTCLKLIGLISTANCCLHLSSYYYAERTRYRKTKTLNFRLLLTVLL
jgi:hypothetical protein